MNRAIGRGLTSGFSEYIMIKPLREDDLDKLLKEVNEAVGHFNQVKKVDRNYNEIRVHIADLASVIHRQRLLTYLEVMFSGRGLDYYVSKVLGAQPKPFDHSGKTLIQELTDPPGIWTEVDTGVKYSIDPQATI